jgi:excisionase family DNA binding protein
MTSHSEMAALGERLLDLLTISEASARIDAIPGVRCSADKVTRLADAGELERVRLGALVRITPESVAAYEQRMAGVEVS